MNDPLTLADWRAAVAGGETTSSFANWLTVQSRGPTRNHVFSTTPVHDHFGLSYAHYHVVERSILQSMPEAWQRAWVSLTLQLEAMCEQVSLSRPAGYCVTAQDEEGITHPNELQDYQRGRRDVLRDPVANWKTLAQAESQDDALNNATLDAGARLEERLLRELTAEERFALNDLLTGFLQGDLGDVPDDDDDEGGA